MAKAESAKPMGVRNCMFILYCHCEEGVLPDEAIPCYKEIASQSTLATTLHNDSCATHFEQ